MDRFQLIRAVDAVMASEIGGAYIKQAQDIADLKGGLMLASRVAEAYGLLAKHKGRRVKHKGRGYVDIEGYFNGAIF